MTPPDLEIVNLPDQDSYEARIDGVEVGRIDYRRSGDAIVFLHTEVGDAYEGMGIASDLAQRALDDARASGTKVIPQCPYIRGWIKRHPDYADLVRGSV